MTPVKLFFARLATFVVVVAVAGLLWQLTALPENLGIPGFGLGMVPQALLRILTAGFSAAGFGFCAHFFLRKWLFRRGEIEEFYARRLVREKWLAAAQRAAISNVATQEASTPASTQDAAAEAANDREAKVAPGGGRAQSYLE
jgi:hypothetical protein